MKRCLLITLSNIGDLVMTTPVFEAINQYFPDMRIHALGDKRSSSLLEPFPYIDKIYNKNKKANTREQFGLLKLLRSVNYDLIVDLRTPFMPFLLKGKKRLIKWKKAKSDQHAVYQHFSILKKIIPDLKEPPPCKLYLLEPFGPVLKIIKQTNPPSDFFVIAPGANWSKKMWPGLNYGHLISSILKQKLVSYIFILGNDIDAEIELGIEIADPRIFDLRGKTKLSEAAYLMSKAKLFIGNDSGLGHMAAGVGCKTLTLFGPGNHSRYKPWHLDGTILLSPESNLENLEVVRVIDKLKGICGCE